MACQRAAIRFLLSARVLLGFYAASAFAAQPSFDCSTASRSDEVAICSDDVLSAMDKIADAGYQFLRSHLGASAANKINLQIIKKRQSCGSNSECIRNVQIEAIKIFKRNGAPIEVPKVGDISPQKSSTAAHPPNHEPQAPETSDRRQQVETEAAPQSSAELGHQQQETDKAEHRAAAGAERRKQEEAETTRRSADQLEVKRQAELKKLQTDLLEAQIKLEQQQSQQNLVLTALALAIVALTIVVAFLVFKLRRSASPDTAPESGHPSQPPEQASTDSTVTQDVTWPPSKDEKLIGKREKLMLARLREKGILSDKGNEHEEKRGS